MSLRVILHIGRHKSGTSALQHYLAAVRGNLDREGILYPRSGSSNRIAHHDIALAAHAPLGRAAELNTIRDAMLAELKPHHHTVLLSSEGFQNLRDLTLLGNFVEGLGAGRVEIICYMREHLDYAVSGFRQMLQKQDRFIKFGAYAREFGDMGVFFTLWDSFGKTRFKWYDRGMLKNGDIIDDMLDQLGITADVVRTNHDKNPSIGGNLLVCKMALNRLGLKGPGYREQGLLAQDEPRFRQAFYISDEVAAALRATSAYNASVFRRLGAAQLKSFADAAPHPILETIDEDVERILRDLQPEDRACVAAEMRKAQDWFTL